uniref:Phospholipid scramblase n=1 Tax=Caenorhabditis japonica TaxID=281687 RepID=A0A8R1DVG8_CAEJA
MINTQPLGEDRKECGKASTMPSSRDTPLEVPNAVEAMPSPMTGFLSLAPHPVLDVIACTNSVMVIQCREPLEIFTGYETANRYVVHDMYLRPLLYCQERSNFVLRNCRGNDRNFRMEMLDVFGKPFMEAIRRKSCCSCGDSLRTEYQGQLIGVMKRLFSSANFEIYGSGCSQPLIIDTPCCIAQECCCNDCSPWCCFFCAYCFGRPYSYPILSHTGQRLGAIVRLFPGFLQHWLTDADSYVINFPADMPPNLKLLLISAVFLIDFAYFED